MTLLVLAEGLESFAVANTAAAELVSTAGSADPAANLAAAGAALGPIGAAFLAAYAPAQAANLGGALLVGAVYGEIGTATRAATTSFIAADNV